MKNENERQVLCSNMGLIGVLKEKEGYGHTMKGVGVDLETSRKCPRPEAQHRSSDQMGPFMPK